MDIVQAKDVAAMGICLDDIFPVKARVGRPSSEPININGGVVLQIVGLNPATGTSLRAAP